MADGLFGSVRGAVETLEQKSGLNPLLFLDAIFGIPGLVSYAYSGKAILLAFVWVPLMFTLVFYGLAFFIDRNFLRSETHVKEMRQLDILGEKGKELTETEVAQLQPVPNTEDKQINDTSKKAAR